jgi:hypothetical protein
MMRATQMGQKFASRLEGFLFGTTGKPERVGHMDRLSEFWHMARARGKET